MSADKGATGNTRPTCDGDTGRGTGALGAQEGPSSCRGQRIPGAEDLGGAVRGVGGKGGGQAADTT